MCGIAGALDLIGTRSFPEERLERMLAALAHRGPDDSHTHAEPGLALGTRRLAIVDVDGGRQPLANEDGSVWVSFNGELFDYAILQRDLLARGHRLATRCDTEVWVHLYEDHGCEVLDRVCGQFAVALWDRRRRTLLLARDRPGICPLHYVESDGWLLWASEIKALLASGMVAPKADLLGIDHLFRNLSHGPSRTCFEGVRSLPPATRLTAEAGLVRLERYWDLDFPDRGEERWGNPRALAEELELLLTRAVERRLRGDVPVVAYLSGGLDSTILAALAARVDGRPPRSFTVRLAGCGPDERALAGESARFLGSSLDTVEVSLRTVCAALPELIVAAEGPLVDTTGAALIRLAQAVHERGYRVALTGEGADETLAGYAWLKIRSAQTWMMDLLSASRPRLYTAEIQALLQNSEVRDSPRHHPDRFHRWHPLNQSLYLAYTGMLPGLLLGARGDRAAMRFSVETRYPYLDEDVVAFAASLAPEYKLRRLTGKWLLRRFSERILPSRIARRPKTMFRTRGVSLLLDRERPPWVDELLSDESLRAAGIFDPAAVAQERVAWDRSRVPLLRRVATGLAMTAVVTTQLWHHLFLGGRLCRLPTLSFSMAPHTHAIAPGEHRGCGGQQGAKVGTLGHLTPL